MVRSLINPALQGLTPRCRSIEASIQQADPRLPDTSNRTSLSARSTCRIPARSRTTGHTSSTFMEREGDTRSNGPWYDTSDRHRHGRGAERGSDTDDQLTAAGMDAEAVVMPTRRQRQREVKRQLGLGRSWRSARSRSLARRCCPTLSAMSAAATTSERSKAPSRDRSSRSRRPIGRGWLRRRVSVFLETVA